MAMDPTAEMRFTRLYEASYADVLAYCARRVNRTDAEDVANEVFTVLWRRLDGIEEESTIAWLYGVAHRTITNRWRGNSRRNRLRERLDGFGVETPEPIDAVVVRRDEDRKVFDALAGLNRPIKRYSAYLRGKSSVLPRSQRWLGAPFSCRAETPSSQETPCKGPLAFSRSIRRHSASACRGRRKAMTIDAAFAAS
jgi:RNA polymerase sigma factor (sigma-70 family)